MKLTKSHVCTRLAGTVVVALAAVLPALADPYQTAVAAQNPLGYWRLDETLAPPAPPVYAANQGSLAATGRGLYVLDVLRGQPGALFGSADTSCRFSNPGWDVLYVGSHIDVSNNAALNPAGPFSVELWAKPSSVAPDDFSPVCSLDANENTNLSREGYIIYYEGTNSGWNFRVGGTTGYVAGVAGGLAAPGQWSHVVGTYSGSSISLYVNGALVGTAAVPSGQFLPNTNATEPFRIGATTIPNRTFDGWIDEVAFYSSALSSSTILGHYGLGTTNGTAYPAAVLASAPVGYWRLDEPGPAAANLGTLGSAADGMYVYDALPGQAGPSSPQFQGFVTGNKAVGFNGVNTGYVILPPLNLFTNTVTITAWIMPTVTSEPSQAGLVINRSGSGTDFTAAGLSMDVVAGLGLSYNWANDPGAYEFDSFLNLSQSVWNFVGLVVQPTETDLYVVDSTNVADFVGSTNYIVQGIQAFAGDTWIGADPGITNYFEGSIAQVAIFDRALGEGDIYSEYAAAVGKVGPTIFIMPWVAPATPYSGDNFTLTVDAGGTPPLSYQWYFGTTPIPGGTNGTLTTLATNTGSFGYSVTVTNPYGSVNGSVTVGIAAPSMPAVSQGPVSRTLYPGATLTLTVTATGGDLVYYWQHAGTNLPGVTGPTYEVASITTNVAGLYVGVASNRIGTAPFGPATITVISPAAGSYEAAVVADAPEAWWRLDEAPGSATMWDSMGRHDGTYTNGGPNPVTLGVPGALLGDPDTAVEFDGASSSYGVVPFSPAINPGQGTIECWVKAATNAALDTAAVSSQFESEGWWIGPSGDLPQDPSGWTFFYNAPGGPYYTTDENPNASGAVNLGWTHVVATYGADAGLLLYVNGYTDGILNGVAGGPFGFNIAGPLIVGALGESAGVAPDTFFAGEVDEVAIYPTILSPARIEAHYLARYGANTAPFFEAPVLSQTVGAGTAVSFSTLVAGSAPVVLQWTKNGAAIPGATNNTLTFTNAAVSDTATYALVATNNVGKTNATASLVVVPAPTFANVTNNLLLHLKFDYTLTDSSGHGNDGTPEGSGLTFVPGKIGAGAISYVTENSTGQPGGAVTNTQYISLGTNADLNLGAAWTNGTSFSVSFWVKLPAGYLGGDLPFLGSATNSANELGFTFCPSYQAGGWEWSLNDGTNDFDVNGAENSINDGNWHHLAFTFDHPTAVGSTYLDGLLVHVDSVAGLGNFDSGQPVTIGQDPTGAYTVPGSADLDDLAIWQMTLTPLQVCTIYGAGVNAKVSFDTVGRPTLKVVRSGQNLVFVWQAGTLVQASGLTGTPQPVAGAAPPTATVTPGPGTKFYWLQ